MKLQCQCEQTYIYDPDQAGQVIQCKWCKQQLRVPLLNELPADKLVELREEHAKAEAKRVKQIEKEQQKQMRTEQKEVQRQQRKEERAVEQAAREIRLTKQAEFDQHQEAVRKQRQVEAKREDAWINKVVGEEVTVGKRYPALLIISQIYRAFAVISFIIAGGAFLLALLALMNSSEPSDSLGSLGMFLMVALFAFSGLLCLATSEGIKVLIDMADDLRMTRLLMKRAVYGGPPPIG